VNALLAPIRARFAGTSRAAARVVAIVDLLEPNNLRPLFTVYNAARDLAGDLRRDLSFIRTLWRGLGPFPDRIRPHAGAIFGRPVPLRLPAISGQRIGIVASGGSGATAAVVGVRRAFEEAGLEPAVISACSGSVLFALPWACGLSAEEIGQFWLSLSTRDYVDPDWRAVARGALTRFRGTTGLLRGEAIERAFVKRFGDRRLGDTKIPFAAVVWNIDANRVEFLSSRRTPDLPVARVARIAISIPIMVEAVELGGAWYGDGGIVDIFPTAPLAEEEPLDLVIGTNSYLPEGFAGMDIGAWHAQPWSILRASLQLRYAVYLELAREHARQLGHRLELIEPVPHTDVRGARFYESFLDRRDWRRYMIAGRTATRAALVRREAMAHRRAA